MTYSLIWLLPVLKNAGLMVAEVPGWTERACRPGFRGEMGRIQGVICHHTASSTVGNMPSLRTLLHGRADVPGPLAQLGLGRDGAFHLIAAGRANHAGLGQGRYVKASGNGSFIGIEAENPIRYQDDWPIEQIDAYQRGVAAILEHIGASADACIAHKEYAHKHKPVDPFFDMDDFRTGVKRIMAGVQPVRPLVPASDAHGRATLRRGSSGDAVRMLQGGLERERQDAATSQNGTSSPDGMGRLKAFEPDGRFGVITEVGVRAFQRACGLRPDGIVGPRTWARLMPT